jgi:hypothetical protein
MLGSASAYLHMHTGTWAVLPMPGDCIRVLVLRPAGSQAAEHGTLKLIIGGSDSHSPSVCLLLRVLWTLVEVARFGTHVGLGPRSPVGKLGHRGIT